MPLFRGMHECASTGGFIPRQKTCMRLVKPTAAHMAMPTTLILPMKSYIFDRRRGAEKAAEVGACAYIVSKKSGAFSAGMQEKSTLASRQPLHAGSGLEQSNVFRFTTYPRSLRYFAVTRRVSTCRQRMDVLGA